MSLLEEARRDLYLGLSLCFSYPSERLVEVASNRLLSRAWGKLSAPARLDSQDSHLADFISLLENELRLAENDRLIRLQADYTRLFVGPFRPKVCCYESLFLNRNCAIINDMNIGLLHTYKQEGVTLAPECRDLPDHIAIELEFMGYLCHRHTRAIDDQKNTLALQYWNQQQLYFQQHIMNWVPMFLTETERAAESEFYRSLAQATRSFLEWETGRIPAPVRGRERRSLCQDQTGG